MRQRCPDEQLYGDAISSFHFFPHLKSCIQILFHFSILYQLSEHHALGFKLLSATFASPLSHSSAFKFLDVFPSSSNETQSSSSWVQLKKAIARSNPIYPSRSLVWSPNSAPPLPVGDPIDWQFVTRSGFKLFVGSKPFYFLGCNAYWLIDDARYSYRQANVVKFMGLAKGLGLRVIRTWGFNTGMPFITVSGNQTAGTPTSRVINGYRIQYEEDAFRGLDFIIQQANLHNLRVILAVGNLWPHYAGPETFFVYQHYQQQQQQQRRQQQNASLNYDIESFYRDDLSRELYKAHIDILTQRRNSLTGTLYNSDPTIMGWDVINEPRCPGCLDPRSSETKWMSEMAAHLKMAAPRQLVLSGSEGFFGKVYGKGQDGHRYGIPTSDLTSYNPGAGSVCEGADWIEVNELESIDVTASHIYWRQTEGQPDENWGRMSFQRYVPWLLNYLRAHVVISSSLGKPHVLEEFNILTPQFSDEQRRIVFQVVFNELVKNSKEGGAFAGAMFWNGIVEEAVHGFRGYNVYIDGRYDPLNSSASSSPLSSGNGGNGGGSGNGGDNNKGGNGNNGGSGGFDSRAKEVSDRNQESFSAYSSKSNSGHRRHRRTLSYDDERFKGRGATGVGGRQDRGEGRDQGKDQGREEKREEEREKKGEKKREYDNARGDDNNVGSVIKDKAGQKSGTSLGTIRRLNQYSDIQDTLDDFRRRQWREACANHAAGDWRPLSFSPWSRDDLNRIETQVAGTSILAVINQAAVQVIGA